MSTFGKIAVSRIVYLDHQVFSFGLKNHTGEKILHTNVARLFLLRLITTK